MARRMGDQVGWGIRERRDASMKIKDGGYSSFLIS